MDYIRTNKLEILFVLCFLAFLVFGIAAPFSARAADQGLVTCGLEAFGGQTPSFCTICDLIALFQRMVNQAVEYFALPIAALMLGYGGFLMVIAGLRGGNAQSYTAGKKVITNVIIGIVILFGSWLLIDTLLKALGAYQYGTGSSFGPWHKIECTSAAIEPPKESTHFACNGDKCEEVKGGGEDGCSNNGNCGAGAKHFECKNKACTEAAGQGTNQCTQNPDNCPKVFYRCVASACVESSGDFTTSNCDPKNNDADCRGSVDDVLSNEEAAKRLANTAVPVDSAGDCKDAGGRQVGALTNFTELKTGEPLTVCNSACKTNGTPCTKSGITANSKMMNDLATTAEAGARYKINSIATGQHESNSDHYKGKAVDLGAVLGTDFPALRQRFLDLNTGGQIRLIQCEDTNGGVVSNCGSGTRHLHISYK